MKHEDQLAVGPDDIVRHWIEKDTSRDQIVVWSSVWYEEEIEGEAGIL